MSNIQPETSLPQYYCMAVLDLVGQDTKLDAMAKVPLVEDIRELLDENLIEDTFLAVQSFRNTICNYCNSDESDFQIGISEFNEEQQQALKQIFKETNVKVRFFAGLAVIYVPLGVKYPVPVAGIFTAFRLSAVMAMLLPNVGHVVRGGITYGWGSIMSNGDLYGPAYYDAYHMATRETCYPRIIVSQKLVDYLKSMTRFMPADAASHFERGYAEVTRVFAGQCKNMLYRDAGAIALDYLGSNLISHYENEGMFPLLRTAVEGMKNYVTTEQITSDEVGDRARLVKARLLEEYINSRYIAWKAAFEPTVVQGGCCEGAEVEPYQVGITDIHGKTESEGTRDSINLMYYCVAVVDYLGQRNILKKMSEQRVEEVEPEQLEHMLDNTTNAIEKLRNSLEVLCGPHTDQEQSLSRIAPETEGEVAAAIQVQYLSDAVVLYVPLHASYPLRSQLQSIRQLLYACAVMIPSVLGEGYVLRGGIEVNWGGELQPREVYGPVLRNAFQLEEKAKHPRIAIGENLIDYLQQALAVTGPDGDRGVGAIRALASHCLACIAPDASDGIPILDYLSKYFNSIYTIEHREHLTSTILPSAIAIAEKKHGEYSAIGNQCLASKYSYLVDYLRNRSTIIGSPVK